MTEIEAPEFQVGDVVRIRPGCGLMARAYDGHGDEVTERVGVIVYKAVTLGVLLYDVHEVPSLPHPYSPVELAPLVEPMTDRERNLRIYYLTGRN